LREKVSRGAPAQGIVRTHSVVFSLITDKGLLLCSELGCGGVSEIGVQRQMKSFMSPILRGTARFDPLMTDS